jgi:hypothetical protein
MDFIFFCTRHWVASTCSTSEVPMPCARLPNAPCVLVCDRHPRQRRPLLRADHVHDALALVQEGEIDLGAEFPDVRVQGLDLQARDRVLDALVPVARRGIVVRRRHDRVDAPGLAAGELEPLERLRAGHFVHQVAVDVDQGRTVGFLADQVAGPELVVKGLRNHVQAAETGLRMQIGLKL